MKVGVLPIHEKSIRSPDPREKLMIKMVTIKIITIMTIMMIMRMVIVASQTCQLRVSSVMCLLLKISRESVQY